MVKYADADLDAVFAALADPTRRGILESLASGDRAVTELAAPHDMSLPGFLKHLRVLEDAGLVARSKEGRVVSCALQAAPLKDAQTWMARYEKFWNERLDSLARYLYQQEEVQAWRTPVDSPKGRRSPSPAATPSGPRKSGSRGRRPKR